MKPNFSILAVLICAVLALAVLSGCGLRSTATPEVVLVEITATPGPTNTPIVITNTPEPPTSTPTRRPTPNRTATVIAQARALYEQAVSEVQPEVEELGQEGGYLHWFNDAPLEMEVSQHNESSHVTLDVGKIEDFVLQSDISWDSTSGLAGCGFTFRADDDLEKGDHYLLAMMRLQYMPVWDIEYYRFGTWQSTITGRTLSSESIKDKPGSTNRVTLVVEGEEMTVYFNGEKEKTYSDKRLTQGNLGFFTWQESGESRCTFSNTWLWVLNAEPPAGQFDWSG